MKNVSRWFAAVIMLFVLAGVYVPASADAQVVIGIGHRHHRHYHHHHPYRR